MAELMGESGLVGGLRETVAFGRATDGAAAPPSGAVGVVEPGSGACAVFNAMVGVPDGVDPGARFDVANFRVGIPVGVGLPVGLVGAPIGTSGLVIVPDGFGGFAVSTGIASGMVGAPVARTGLVAAGALGTSGLVPEPVASGMVGAPVARTGLVAAGALGTSGLVPEPVASGMVGAPVARTGLVAAGALGTSGLVPEPVASGMVGAPAKIVGLLVASGAVGGFAGGPATGTGGLLIVSGEVGEGADGLRGGAGLGMALEVNVPDAPAIFIGMTGAGAGVFVRALASGEGAGLASATLPASVADNSGATGITGLGVAAGMSRTGFWVSVEGKEAEGTAGGASDALRVTRTVSFFSVTLEVCSDGEVFSFIEDTVVLGM